MDNDAGRAIVLGGSMAGILAARVLAERFGQVTIVERDQLPAVGDDRRGVPQGRHVHALLTRGKRVIDELFPGATADLVARGALLGRATQDATLFFYGSRMCRTDAGLEVLSVSRPLLEGYLRERVLGLPGVDVIQACEAHGLTSDPERTRITGVRLLARADGSPEEILTADLVVDATGRASRLPVWLEELGYPTPREDVVKVGVTYVSCRYPRQPGDLHAIIVGGVPPGRRGGAAHAEEGDRWIVTLGGRLGEEPPTDLQGFVEYAASLPIPDLYELIRDRAPLTTPVLMRYPASRRRRYEAMPRWPDGLLVLGDALCSFNPIYGQGMSVAAAQAQLLAACLSDGSSDVGRRFLQRVPDVLDVAWEMAMGGDMQYPEVEGPRTARMRIINRYLNRLTKVASTDPAVATAFMRVVMLTARPETLLHPRTSLRVLAGSLRRGARGEIPHQRREHTGRLPAGTP